MKQLLFITYLLNGDTHGLQMWLAAVGIMALLPVIASLFDLRTGIKKSKIVGNFKTTSYGLKKTRDKDLVYLLFYLMFAMIDCCLSFIVDFPLLCVFCSIAEVAIEAWSIHENIAVINKDMHDPIDIMKAISCTYGINDPDKLAIIFDKIQKSKEEAAPRPSPKGREQKSSKSSNGSKVQEHRR